MAVDAVSLGSTRVGRRSLADSARAIPARVVLGGMIIMSAVVRFATALPHSTPRYFPDEYIYAALARSIAHGHLTIRGTAAHFPALLEPLLAAPLTLVGNVETAYRLTQAMHSVLMSLAAIPIFLLARRLDLPRGQQLACAALTLVVPEFIYTSYITADAVALPLALGAVYAGVVALEQPTRRTQAMFLVLAALATFDRVQYVVLPAAFLAATLVVTRGRVIVAIRRYRFTLIGLALPVATVLTAGSGRALGYYRGVLHLGVDPRSIGHWVAIDAMMLVFACGVATIPGAIVGLGFGLARPTTSFERAFAAITAALAALLLIELGIYAASGTARFQGRYLEALPPLVPVLFCLGMRQIQTKARRRTIVGLSVGALLLALRVPLSGYIVGDAKQDSPFLQAVGKVEQQLGVGSGALAVSLAASLLAAVAALAVWRPVVGTRVVLGVVFLVFLAMSTAVVRYDAQTSRRALLTYFPSGRRWVDDAKLGRVAILVTPSSSRGSISGTLFWNTSTNRLLQMRGAQQVDAFGAAETRVRRDGALLADGAVYKGNLLVEEYADSAQVENAELVSRTISTALWKTAGIPRLVSLTDGRYLDGWLGWKSTVTVWPGATGARSGALCMSLMMPAAGTQTTIDVTAPGVHQTVVLAAGTTRQIALPIRITAPWRLHIAARRPLFLADNRLVASQSSVPRFIAGKASPATCR